MPDSSFLVFASFLAGAFFTNKVYASAVERVYCLLWPLECERRDGAQDGAWHLAAQSTHRDEQVPQGTKLRPECVRVTLPPKRL